MVRCLTNNWKWFLLRVASKVEILLVFLPFIWFECYPLRFIVWFVCFYRLVSHCVLWAQVLIKTEPGVWQTCHLANCLICIVFCRWWYNLSIDKSFQLWHCVLPNSCTFHVFLSLSTSLSATSLSADFYRKSGVFYKRRPGGNVGCIRAIEVCRLQLLVFFKLYESSMNYRFIFDGWR